MFDPHRTRRNDRRYYTRKGQVLQASRVNTQPIIDQRLVPVYKNFLLANGLAYDQPQPVPATPIDISGIAVNDIQYTWADFIKYETSTVTINRPTGLAMIAILFYIDTSGNSFIEFKYQAPSSTYNKTIENVKVCYFQLFSPPSTITNQNTLDNANKGIIDSTADNYIINFYGSQISIKNDIKLTPV
uniref:Putative ORF3 n=1 Tax=Po-Circo-like virus 21 TaxID=1105383 RepID=A0A8G1LTJ8_9VIRU|nr:putative ORF3 [Po-Circo-like virus 21]